MLEIYLKDFLGILFEMAWFGVPVVAVCLFIGFMLEELTSGFRDTITDALMGLVLGLVVLWVLF